MKVLVIDDDPASLAALEWMVRRGGHEAVPCGDPHGALRLLAPGIDLVISDVDMPGLDGFAVAAEAAARLSRSPPRTLLVSGLRHPEEMAATPADRVMGLLLKPVSAAHAHRVLELIAQTRNACPGVVGPFCPLRDFALAHGEESVICSQLHCRSANYACCPHYGEQAGRELRTWIEQADHGAPPP